ncbi:glycosyltransferase involved in cell wall biosynthesis [Nakamurella sp. UYEF19]|uniref:glycosyltransferase family 4 protein n=1 Tax=Nakamurella sp. UYEF19 TaxID=1756392 RepID=UPI0033909C15
MSRTRPGAIPRVVLDATPLLGQRTGIGRYTEHLLAALAARDDISVSATAFTLRGWRELAAAVPPGVSVRARPFPARLLRAAWQRTDLPRVEWLIGSADIMHGTNFVLPPTSRAAGVVTIHDLAWLTHRNTLRTENDDLRILVPRALRQAKAVCTFAEVTRHAISTEFGYPLERIFLTPHGVDPSWFDPPAVTDEQRAVLDLPDRYFVFVGTREPRKGLDTLLAAHRLLRDRIGDDCPDLLLVGPQGWGTDHAGAPQLGVRLAGYLPQAILPSVVAGSVGLVLPSVDEGFGMPAIEALASGVPVVTTDIPVLAEVTGSAALRFPVCDETALSARLQQVLDGEVPPSVDRVAWARRFTWENCAEQTMRAYRCALAARATDTTYFP